MELELTQGKKTVFDDEDWHLLSPYKWYTAKQADGLFYAITKIWVPSAKKQKNLQMHRLIMGEPPGLEVDHRAGDGLDNRKLNLRVATHLQNSRNRRKKTNVVWSGYKGVTWNWRNARWKAAIWTDGKSRHLGYFGTQEDAAMAYDRAAQAAFKEFARLNFPLAA